MYLFALTRISLLLLLFIIPVYSQSDRGSNHTWILCTVTRVSDGEITGFSCPRLKPRETLKIVSFDDIPAVVGTSFFMRRAGKCLIPTSVDDQDRDRFIRFPTNIDCEDGRVFKQTKVGR